MAITKDIITVAVVGAGVGRGHAEAFYDLKDQYRLKYLCDIDLERAQDAVKEFDGVEAIADLEAVLADPEIDLVDLCLPPHLHYSGTMQVLNAGKHVVCEKPFMLSLEQSDEVIAHAEKLGLQIVPMFQYRYGNGYRRLMELKKRSLTGKAYTMSIETNWQRGEAYYAVPWRGTWKGEMGGSIVSHAIHIHNLATHCLGNAVEVAAMLDTRVNDIETEDCGALSFRMESGALVTSSFTLGNAGNMSRLRVHFENLTAESDEYPYMVGGGDWKFTATDPAKQDEIDAAISGFDDVLIRYHGLFSDAYHYLRDEEHVYLPSLAEARHSIELVTAIYESSRERKFVALPLPINHPLYAGWVTGD